MNTIQAELLTDDAWLILCHSNIKKKHLGSFHPLDDIIIVGEPVNTLILVVYCLSQLYILRMHVLAHFPGAH